MIKGMLGDDSMSNLTSASNEASISSTNNRIEIGSALYPQLQNIQTQPPSNKKKRNLPGNPGTYTITPYVPSYLAQLEFRESIIYFSLIRILLYIF